MDNLTHSLVGLASAKAGLDRLSPYATTVCVVSANIADADFVTLFFGDRWTLLEHHRGMTHSIVGTIAIGLLVPSIAFAIELVVASLRKRAARIRFGGLLVASLIAAATHPLLDWTNNYGVRPLLPWNGRWFYGDLVFIFDPYIWLGLGGVAFLLTGKSKAKAIGWAVLGLAITAFIGLAGWRSGPDGGPLRIAFVVWLVGMLGLARLHPFGVKLRGGRATAIAALAVLVLYWGALDLAHRLALSKTVSVANSSAAMNGERVLRVAAMPSVATPLAWQSVVETDQAIYRFRVRITGAQSDASSTVVFNRFLKPTGQSADLVSLAGQDRRAQALLGFARFPLGQVDASNCAGQALVQFADLRYTEPGGNRGNFSVNIPVDCPTR